MDHKFLAISGVVVNAAHIESIRGLSEADGTAVHIHFISGNNTSFTGTDADALRRYFAPQTELPPPLPPVVEPAKGAN